MPGSTGQILSGFGQRCVGPDRTNPRAEAAGRQEYGSLRSPYRHPGPRPPAGGSRWGRGYGVTRNHNTALRARGLGPGSRSEATTGSRRTIGAPGVGPGFAGGRTRIGTTSHAGVDTDSGWHSVQLRQGLRDISGRIYDWDISESPRSFCDAPQTQPAMISAATPTKGISAPAEKFSAT